MIAFNSRPQHRPFDRHRGRRTQTTHKRESIMNTSAVQHSLPQHRSLAKWCGCALVLLLPGSFVVLALLWILRRCVLPGGRQ
jgi:hypothetical protein